MCWCCLGSSGLGWSCGGREKIGSWCHSLNGVMSYQIFVFWVILRLCFVCFEGRLVGFGLLGCP